MDQGGPCTYVCAWRYQSSRGPDCAHHCKMGSVVMEPRANVGGLLPTLSQSLLWKAPWDSYPLGEFKALKVVFPCLDSTGHICWCQCHCLTKDKSRVSTERYFIVLGDITISLTLVKPCSTLLREGVKQISQWNLTLCLVTLTLAVNLLHTRVQEGQRLPHAFSP